MKVKLTRNVLIKGKHHDAGKTVEVDDHLASWLINRGKAVDPSKEKAAKAKAKAEAKAKAKETK